MTGDLIVGYDGSDCAQAALAKGAELARLYGSGLVIAFGYEPPAVSAEMSDHRRALEELGERLTGEALAALGDPPVRATAAVVDARPADALLALAKEHDASMIVVGTHSERPLLGVVLGSTAYKLLHRSSIPVLVVPA
jgi:nucleotide-binding universal stress UspA family protein